MVWLTPILNTGFSFEKNPLSSNLSMILPLKPTQYSNQPLSSGAYVCHSQGKSMMVVPGVILILCCDEDSK